MSTRYDPSTQEYQVSLSSIGTFELKAFDFSGKKLYISPENREKIRKKYEPVCSEFLKNTSRNDSNIRGLTLIVTGFGLDLERD